MTFNAIITTIRPLWEARPLSYLIQNILPYSLTMGTQLQADICLEKSICTLAFGNNHVNRRPYLCPSLHPLPLLPGEKLLDPLHFLLE
jgi:hypothetical protein